MEHKTLEQLERVAEVRDQPQTPVLTPIQRLERWADLLEGEPDRHLNTLHGTEYQTATARDAMRCANSPISVAFADPVLHDAGLSDDTYGTAKRFFEISDHELHEALCYCHYGPTMRAGTAARSVRGIIAHRTNPGILSRVRSALPL